MTTSDEDHAYLSVERKLKHQGWLSPEVVERVREHMLNALAECIEHNPVLAKAHIKSALSLLQTKVTT